MKKLPHNWRERKVAIEHLEDGWEVLKKGWPDFLMIKDGKIKMIEVKRRQRKETVKMGLSSHQIRMREILSQIHDYEVRYI